MVRWTSISILHFTRAGDDHIALYERRDPARDNVARAQSNWGRCREQDVACTDSYEQGSTVRLRVPTAFRARPASVSGDAASHGAALGSDRFHHGVEDVFEAHQLCDRFLLEALQLLRAEFPERRASPASRTSSCSPSAKTSSRLWVTYRMGMRCARFQVRRSSMIFALVTASRAASGSSRSSTAGSVTSVRANAVRCFSPPEISLG